jgi:hypothetical protein
MRLPSLHRILLPLAAALALAACHHQNAADVSGGSTPEAAVQESAQLIKDGNFAGFWKHALPPADYATMRADWSQLRPDRRPITDADRAQFAQTMQQLTAPDAETKLYAELQPKLAQMEKQYKDQLPVMAGIGQTIAGTAIAQSKTISEAQKKQANDVLAALLPWAQKAPWFDQARAKQAVGVVVATARQLDLKSPDALRTLDFDAAMAKYAQVFGGLKQLLAIYGLSIDDTLDSVKATTVSIDHGRAHVQIGYTLLGKPLDADAQMILDHGRWYDEALVQSVRNAHQQLLQRQAQAKAAAGASAVAAGTAPATPASTAPAALPAAAPAPAASATAKPTAAPTAH